MKLSQHNELMDKIWSEIISTRNEGQKEYAQDKDNVFANFERISEQLKIDRQHVLWVYLAKHIDGIASFINGHHSQREDVRGRITDVIVYLCLLWGMIDQDEFGIEKGIDLEVSAEHQIAKKFKGEWKPEPKRKFEESDE